jgi:CPA2 family monovalent cation:H+ antiporter-2
MVRRIDTNQIIELHATDGADCSHLDQVRAVEPSAVGCEECLETGGSWVNLRICMICGHVGCCDASPGKHATAHYHASKHPIIRSLEPGETWGWCYEDQVTI